MLETVALMGACPPPKKSLPMGLAIPFLDTGGEPCMLGTGPEKHSRSVWSAPQET